VVGMNLCPFAAKPIAQKRVRVAVSDARDEHNLLTTLQDEILTLAQDPDIETTLLVHPLVLQDFLDYNAFLSTCDALIADMNAEGVFQIASFHPQYQFADAGLEDAENYTNRSPYPLLHILRESSLSQAIDTHPDIDDVPVRNIARLNSQGATSLHTTWLALSADQPSDQ